jgi:hypothetical protein
MMDAAGGGNQYSGILVDDDSAHGSAHQARPCGVPRDAVMTSVRHPAATHT